MELVQLPKSPIELENFCAGTFVKGSGVRKEVLSPYTNTVIGTYHLSNAKDLENIVNGAKNAFLEWSNTSIKDRCKVMFQVREILLRDLEKISHMISAESGKTVPEAKAGLMKGIEVIEFATAIQNIDLGGKMEVSKGVFCEYRREPIGIVAGITPFNFPAMVPLWMIPIALALGNCFIWKPSDKTPLTSYYIAKAFQEAGLPNGALSVIHGEKSIVEEILRHKEISAIGFVGSTPVAKSIYQEGSKNLKRVLALGGAKNHIFLMPDADPIMAAQGIRDSFTGCAGQRCMASSVLIAVGKSDEIVKKVIEESSKLQLGTQMGAIITKNQKDFLSASLQKADSVGAKLVLDGRKKELPKNYESGNWLGPSIVDQVNPKSFFASDELFGPILSIIRTNSLEEAIQIENNNAFGNAASVFTSQGAIAELVISKSRAGMVGINIGVPVPREPFSFGGLFESKFGYSDITGHGGINFWSNIKKVTSKWTLPQNMNWMS